LAENQKIAAAQEVCAVSAKYRDAKTARRMLAVAMVLEWYDKTKRCGIGFTVITLRGWRS
jgi:hypothetical protein